MARYLLYPTGYDPMIAAGPPERWQISAGINWSQEETWLHQMLELQTEEVELPNPPKNRWYQAI